jgi:hypothetical protein
VTRVRQRLTPVSFQFFTASLRLLSEIGGIEGSDAALSPELRAGLARRKAAQTQIHKSMSEYLDLVATERVRTDRDFIF